jgi:hypothetical protein
MRVILTIVALIGFFTGNAVACSRLTPSAKIGHRFSVLLQRPDKAGVSHVRIELLRTYPRPAGEEAPEPTLFATRKTNGKGIARFADVPSGRYVLRVSTDFFFEDWEHLLEVQDGVTTNLLRIAWPTQIVRTHRLSGVLKHGDWRPPTALDKAELQLFSLVSDKPLKTTVTDGNGTFDFGKLKDGYYVLSVMRHYDERLKTYAQFLVPVQIDRRNKVGALTITATPNGYCSPYFDSNALVKTNAAQN